MSSKKRRRPRNVDEDRAAVLGALTQDKDQTASEIKVVSGVPKKYVRRAVTVNADGTTAIAGVKISKSRGKHRFRKSS